MMLSELISDLNALYLEHGDLPCEDEYGNECDHPEFNNDDGACVLFSFSES